MNVEVLPCKLEVRNILKHKKQGKGFSDCGMKFLGSVQRQTALYVCAGGGFGRERDTDSTL